MRMTRTSLHRAATLGAVLSLGFAGAACSASNEPATSDSGSGSGSGSGSSLSGTLSGAGSSAQEAAQGAWRSGFQTANPDVTVNYDPIGSGGGREQFEAGGSSFAGSDAPLTDDELAKAKEQCGGSVIEVPNYVSPIALVYNLPGVDNLQLSPDAIGGIFAGDITKWNDPAIAGTNKGVKLPSSAITPVHRGDDSGTTENFTEYLDQASKSWTEGVVETWPIKGSKGGAAAQGTSGIISKVSKGENTIGYADASQAGDLSVAKVQVGSEFVGPTADAAAKILENSPREKGRDATDIVYTLDRGTTASGTYPVVLTSYFIACPTYKDKQTADLVKAYATYVLSSEGQQAAAKAAGSAPLPTALSDEAEKIVSQIKVG